MSSKIWNDVIGVSRGLWSVVQKAQTSNFRIHRTPRHPSQERMDMYTVRKGKSFEISEYVECVYGDRITF